MILKRMTTKSLACLAHRLPGFVGLSVASLPIPTVSVSSMWEDSAATFLIFVWLEWLSGGSIQLTRNRN
jgi:hypothetical protein